MTDRTKNDTRAQDTDGFGDDGGTRVGRPDAPSRAAPSTHIDPDGLEGSVLEDDDAAAGEGAGQAGVQRAAAGGAGRTSGGGRGDDAGSERGKSGTGGSLGGGSEAVEGLNATGGRDASQPSSVRDAQQSTRTTGHDGEFGAADRAGSEPLDREHEHKPSYGGEGGTPRTSSDQREPINPS